MVLHMAVVATMKLKLLSCTSHSLITPLVSGLILPFVIKLSFSLRLVRRTYTDVIHASRLFFFQMEQIIRAIDEHGHADHDEHGHVDHDERPAVAIIGTNNNSRLERALRLVHQTVTNRVRQSSEALQLDEQSIHTLAMIAL